MNEELDNINVRCCELIDEILKRVKVLAHCPSHVFDEEDLKRLIEANAYLSLLIDRLYYINEYLTTVKP